MDADDSPGHSAKTCIDRIGIKPLIALPAFYRRRLTGGRLLVSMGH